MFKLMPPLLAAAVVTAVLAIGAGAKQSNHDKHAGLRQVTVPEADRFTPYAITIQAGDTVRWVNHDGDNHTVVSDNAFDTTGHQGTKQLLPANGGTVSITFNHPGTFVYYCEFHAHLDAENQPVAPGPDGGIQDEKGNFGTPMTGVVTVLPNHDSNNEGD
jgi:plastocyanin